MMIHKKGCALAAFVLISTAVVATPLEEYVHTPDPAYTYEIQNSTQITYLGMTYTQYELRMYSQRWRASNEVDKPLWWHKMIIAIPHAPLTDMGMLMVEGGFTGMWIPPVDLRERMAKIRSPFALLLYVPNEPLLFSDESETRTEDEIISYSFDKYIRTGDSAWPVLGAMTKAAVRAMDTVVALARDMHDVEVKRFCVGGASKRGWTAWLTAAVDPRVEACVPIVIDTLNMEKQINHHFDSLGFYSSSIAPYVNDRIFDRFWLPRGKLLAQMVDPFEYRDRLTMPKFIVCSPGDSYFLPDGSQFYLPYLPGENLLRYVPNTDHGIGSNSTVLTSIENFFVQVSRGQNTPKISWEFLPDGALRVVTERGFPSGAKLWQAYNPNARNFFYSGGSGITYASTDLVEETPGSNSWVARVDTPETGFRAWFVEVRFAGAPILTTHVYIVPDVLPFKPNVRIASQAQGGSFPANAHVELFVTTEGASESLAYQWYKDGDPISLKAQSAMTLASLSAGDEGYYACRVKEGARRAIFSDAIPVFIQSDFHSADWHQGPDGRIDLSELLRVIQFYNSGAYSCAATDDPSSDEGYQPGLGDRDCKPHNSDYNPQDWIIDLSELLRLIQFFNSGGYHACDDPINGEDGFCPGQG